MNRRTTAKAITRGVMRARAPYDATKSEAMRAEALDRARTGQSFSNYPAIFEGFAAKGIADVRPRENVFTYEAWRAQGRQVRRGEHGVRVVTFVEMSRAAEPGEEPETWRHPRSTVVFHISQTEAMS